VSIRPSTLRISVAAPATPVVPVVPKPAHKLAKGRAPELPKGGQPVHHYHSAGAQDVSAAPLVAPGVRLSRVPLPPVTDPHVFAELFKSGGWASVAGLCGRLLRGTDAKQFETLSDDMTRRLVLVMGSEGLEKLMGKPGHEMLVEVGYTPEFIHHKVVDERCQFKLVVFEGATVGKQATWANIIELACQAYPSVQDKLRAQREALEATAFADIEQAAGYRFASVTDTHDARFMNLEHFSASAGSLVDVRAFLFHSVYLTELFTGDGFTRTDSGERGVAEYMCPNTQVSGLGSYAIIDVDVKMPMG